MRHIRHGGNDYPSFQADGNAAQFAIPFAKQVCKGSGLDIGYCKDDWRFPGAMGIEKGDTLPDVKVDFVFSSHCLEHIPNWVATLDKWVACLNTDGTLFLYLPDFSQTYWRPWNNRKHLHAFTPEIIKAYLKTKFEKVFVSGIDLNNSFCAYGYNPW